MPASLKIILSSLGAVIGIGGAIPAALWQSGHFNSSTRDTTSSVDFGDTASSHDSSPSMSSVTRGVKEENCEVVNTIEEAVFQGLHISKGNYTTIHCKDTNVLGSERNISSEWTGLFPNDLLLNNDSLIANTKFKVETNTESATDDYDEEYKTTFSGNKFMNPPIVGKWGNQAVDVSGKSITTVTVTDGSESISSSKIYLLFTKRQD